MTKPNDSISAHEALLTELTLHHLEIGILAIRNSENLGFCDVAICKIRDALDADWQAGRKAR